MSTLAEESAQINSFFSVSQAAKELVLSASTLRRLESERRIVSSRDHNNSRIYSKKAVLALKEELSIERELKEKIKIKKKAERAGIIPQAYNPIFIPANTQPRLRPRAVYANALSKTRWVVVGTFLTVLILTGFGVYALKNKATKTEFVKLAETGKVAGESSGENTSTISPWLSAIELTTSEPTSENPQGKQTLDILTESNFWQDMEARKKLTLEELFVRKNVEVDGTIKVGKDIIAKNDITARGGLTVDENTIIGYDNTKTVALNAKVSSDIIPYSTSAYNLGSSSLRWNQTWGKDANFSGSLVVTGTITPSGQMLLSDGTFTSPSLAFANDTNSGLYRISNDKIGLITGGSATQGLTIDSSGYIGIGTTSPITLFEIRKDQNTETKAQVTNKSTGTSAFSSINLYNGSNYSSFSLFGSNFTTSGTAIQNSTRFWTDAPGGLSFVSGHSSGPVRFYSGGSTSPNMFIGTSGNVGIGTTNPLSKLDVIGAITSSSTITGATLTDGTASITTGNISGVLDIDASTGTVVTLDGTTLTYTTGYLSTLDLGTNTITDENLTGNWLASGYLGVGSTNPTYKLNVDGNTNLTSGNAYYINGASVLNATTLGSNVVTSSLTTVGALTSGSIASGFGTIATANTISTSSDISTTGSGTITSAGLLTASNGLTLTTGALNLTSTSGNANLTLGNSTTAFNINGLFDVDTANSRVGIGTTSPSYKLEVNGTLGIGSTATFSSLISAANIGTGTDNSVLVLDSSGYLRTDEIDPDVWTAGTLLDGNGTANYLPYYLDTDTLAISNMYYDGTNIGIGTTAPSKALELSGNVPYAGYGTYGILVKNAWGPAALQIDGGVKNDAGSPGYTRTAAIDFKSGGTLRWGIGIHPLDDSNTGFKIWESQASDAIRFMIDAGGNVGIGNTNPTYGLDVTGTGRFTDNVDIANGLDITGANLTVGGSNFSVTTAGAVTGVSFTDSTATLTGGNITGVGDIDASTGTIVTLDGTTLTYTTGNLTTLDLGTNTITDTNLTGNWLASGYLGIGTTNPTYKLNVDGNTNLTTGNAYYINGASVLNATTLGSGVLASSLTSTGALTGGSIASGFGTIATANTITGTTLNGTTGINTGAVGGTQRIDSSGNLLNIGNISASGTLGVGSTASFSSLVNIASLTASQAVYTDANKNLTSTIPTSGTLGYWQRNETYVSPATITDYVGIGTTSPADLLSVGTASQFQVSSTGAVTVAAGFSQTGANTFSTGTGTVSLNGETTIASGKNLTLTAGNITLSSGLLTQTGSGNNSFAGNVGIGTTDPGSYGLNVTGTGYFGGALTLGTQASTTSHAVRADRNLTLTSDTNVTITNSGSAQDLTSDRSWTLGWTGLLSLARGGTGIGTTNPANGTLLIGNGTGYTVANITGTTDQITVTSGAGTIGLSLPQSIATTSIPTFAGLGIGATNPSYELNVVGNANLTTGNAYYINGTSVLNGTTLGSGVLASSLTSTGALTGGSIASGFGTIATANTISTSSDISTTGSGTITSAGLLTASNALTVTTGNLNLSNGFLIQTGAGNNSFAGNVGIGTTNPTSMLSVGASSQFQVNSTGNIVKINNVITSFPGSQGVLGSVLTNSDGAGTLTWASPSGSGAIGYWTRTSTNLLPTTAGDDLYLPTNSVLGVGYDPSTITGGVAAFSGNVGIGTTAPGAKLDVNGTSRMGDATHYITTDVWGTMVWSYEGVTANVIRGSGVTYFNSGNVGIGT
ncbi:MAG: MerR family transcriptional regulator, partial [bacterium]